MGPLPEATDDHTRLIDVRQYARPAAVSSERVTPAELAHERLLTREAAVVADAAARVGGLDSESPDALVEGVTANAVIAEQRGALAVDTALRGRSPLSVARATQASSQVISQVQHARDVVAEKSEEELVDQAHDRATLGVAERARQLSTLALNEVTELALTIDPVPVRTAQGPRI